MKFNFPAIAGGVAALLIGAAQAQDTIGSTTTVETTTRGTVLNVPEDRTASAPESLPTRSMNKAAVRRKFGTPVRSFPAVGDPPITRWDYNGFRVFFEYDLVLHTLVPGAFPNISNRDQLTPAR